MCSHDYPAELWDEFYANAIAEQNGAVAALLNGPRYWLMSSIGKTGRESLEHKTFGRGSGGLRAHRSR